MFANGTHATRVSSQLYIAREPSKNGWVYDLDADEYHEDLTRLSSTELRRVLKSPQTFLAYHHKLVQQPETKALSFGKTAHTAILEGDKFWKRHVVKPVFTGLTKDGRQSTRSAAAKEKEQEWLDALPKDAILVTEEELACLEGMMNSIVRHRDAFAILKDSAAEATGYYTDPLTNINLRIRPDVVKFDLSVMADVKTTRDCSLWSFQRDAFGKRYDFQASMYLHGSEEISRVRNTIYVFIAIEKEPPFEVAVYAADDAFLEMGDRDYRKALDTLSKCIATGKWPGYMEANHGSGIENLGLPPYAFIKE